MAKNYGNSPQDQQNIDRVLILKDQTWGQWTVIGNVIVEKKIDCRCECGTIKNIDIGNLQKGKTTGCGCKAKAKRAATNTELFGTPNAMQSEAGKEAYKQTSLDKYGVEHPFLSQEVQDKKTATYIKNYGSEHAVSSPAVQDKISATLKRRKKEIEE